MYPGDLLGAGRPETSKSRDRSTAADACTPLKLPALPHSHLEHCFGRVIKVSSPKLKCRAPELSTAWDFSTFPSDVGLNLKKRVTE